MTPRPERAFLGHSHRVKTACRHQGHSTPPHLQCLDRRQMSRCKPILAGAFGGGYGVACASSLPALLVTLCTAFVLSPQAVCCCLLCCVLPGHRRARDSQMRPIPRKTGHPRWSRRCCTQRKGQRSDHATWCNSAEVKGLTSAPCAQPQPFTTRETQQNFAVPVCRSSSNQDYGRIRIHLGIGRGLDSKMLWGHPRRHQLV